MQHPGGLTGAAIARARAGVPFRNTGQAMALVRLFAPDGIVSGLAGS
jgi:hypothetical protein